MADACLMWQPMGMVRAFNNNNNNNNIKKIIIIIIVIIINFSLCNRPNFCHPSGLYL